MVTSEPLPRTPGIYAIWLLDENEIECRVYFGSAADICARKGTHVHQLRKNKHHNKHLQRAWNKYGETRFRFEVIEYVPSKTHLIAREQFWLDTLVDELGREILFNACLTAGNTLGFKFSEESRAKMSATRMGRASPRPPGWKMSDEQKARLSKLATGRSVSDETRAKISASQTGICRWSNETRAKMSAALKGQRPTAAIEAARLANTGRPIPEERKEKISATLKGRIFSPEHIAKIRKAFQSEEVRERIGAVHRGIPKSPEHAAKISAALKGRRPSNAAIAASHTPEALAKLSAALKGRRPSEATLKAAHSAESRAKRSASLKGRPKSPEHVAKIAASRPVGGSGIRGVKKHKDKWVAIAPGNVYLGIFTTIEEAATAYQDAVLLNYRG